MNWKKQQQGSGTTCTSMNGTSSGSRNIWWRTNRNGTKEDLVELYLDTCQMISQLEKTGVRLTTVSTPRISTITLPTR